MPEIAVLVVEDDPAAAEIVRSTLSSLVSRVVIATNGEEAMEHLNGTEFKLLVADRNLPGIDGLALARKAKEMHPDLRIILIAVNVSPEWEQKAKSIGVEWVSQTLSSQKLREVFSKILSTNSNTHSTLPGLRVDEQPELSLRTSAIIGNSEPMQEVFRLIEKSRISRAPVLIQGESGTGKELVARAISKGGPSEGKMVVVNCCALSDSLIESELFGHSRGAFSGALADREGLFEAADGGTLFLDEIGDIPLRSQTKLLRVLQEGEFRRVGENRLRHVQVRILTATNRDLREAIEHRQFREDLYYRLNVIPIYLPPLRERISDVTPLIHHFLQKHRRKNQPIISLSESALNRLVRYNFPGNIRELENIAQRALSLARGVVITEKEIESCLQSSSRPESSTPTFIGRTYGEWKRHMRIWEREFLEENLKTHSFRVSDSAKTLGVARTALHNRIKALGIKLAKTPGNPAASEGGELPLPPHVR